MHNLSLLEECYQKFIKRLEFWVPEGVYFINLELLNYFDLLHFQPSNEYKSHTLSHCFHIIESFEKITLLNDKFVIWIMPGKSVEQTPITYTLIALNRGELEPQLKVAFIATGVYNSSKLILKVLEKFLIEIPEIEATLDKFQKTKG